MGEAVPGASGLSGAPGRSGEHRGTPGSARWAATRLDTRRMAVTGRAPAGTHARKRGPQARPVRTRRCPRRSRRSPPSRPWLGSSYQRPPHDIRGYPIHGKAVTLSCQHHPGHRQLAGGSRWWCWPAPRRLWCLPGANGGRGQRRCRAAVSRWLTAARCSYSPDSRAVKERFQRAEQCAVLLSWATRRRVTTLASMTG
jgi:hypothetical protein